MLCYWFATPPYQAMKLRSLAALTGSFAILAANAWAIPLSSEVTSNVDLVPGTTITDTQSWSGVPQDITSSAGELENDSSISASASAFNFAPNGNSGQVNLSAAWDLAAGTTYAAAEGTSWLYSFVADATGDFVMDYTLSLTGRNSFGLNGFYLFGDLGSHYFSAANTTGQFTAGVIAGNTYTINLRANANISGTYLQGYNGQLDGSFNWSLPGEQSVPDHGSSVALLTLSLFGLVAFRRKLNRS